MKHVYPAIVKSVLAGLLVLVGACGSLRAEPGTEIPWPIDAAQYISSSFGEPRPGRFHMGVDFKSNGVIGREVYAVAAGTIVRVRTTPFNEGKALYIRHDSGETSVYMHLSRFRDDIEDVLFEQRIANGSYDVDWWAPAGKYRVSRGDLIGWSGDSGSWGAPHLHFELRNADNEPINPLDHGLTIHDTLPPDLRAAVLVPLDKASSIDGHPQPLWIDFNNPPAEPLALSGNIGIALSVWDRVDGTRNIMGVYRAAVLVDSTTVFSKTYDRISYNINGCGGLDYVSGVQYGRDLTLSTLFRRPGNFIDFYNGADCLVCDTFPQGSPAILTVHTEDHPGNTSDGSLPVVFGTRPWFSYCGFSAPDTIRVAGYHRSADIVALSLATRGTDGEWIDIASYPVEAQMCDIAIPMPITGPGEFRVVLTGADSLDSLPVYLATDPDGDSAGNCAEMQVETELMHDRAVIRITANRILASVPEVSISCNGAPQNGIHTPVPDGEKSWVMAAAFPQAGPTTLDIAVTATDPSGAALTASAQMNFTGIATGSSITVHSPDSLMTMAFPSDALYRSAPVAIESAKLGAKGMKSASPVYRVTLADDPPHNAATLRLALDDPDAPPQTAIYYTRNGGSSWKFLSKERDGAVLTGGYNGTGHVAAFIDDTAPWVSADLPKPGSTVTDRRPTIRIRLEDRGSGIEGSDSIRMAIDGIAIYGEYNTGLNRVTYRLHNPLDPGTHTVSVTVTDRAGNATSREWSFTVK